MGRKGRGSSQTGMSLVEATIILMVLAVLTAVLAPSILDFVDDARRTKAKEDCEAIGVSMVRLLKDTGVPFLLRSGSLTPIADRYAMANRVNLLVSDGDIPANAAAIPAAATNTGNILPTSVNWTDTLGSGTRTMYDNLVANNPGYEAPASPLDTLDPGKPESRGAWGLGWRGAYLSGVIGPDPWANRYAVNSVYLGAALDATTDGEGERGRGWSFDTFCLSAGPDARIEANFEDTIASSVGGGTSLDDGTVNDDIIFVIAGFGR